MSRPIIAILRGIPTEQAAEAASVIIEAGITTIEVPMNSPDPIGAIKAMVDAHGQQALIGAGTVLSKAQADAVADVGGKLIVSPNTNPDVIAHTVALGLQSWPGAFTPTECFAALEAGATGLKLFPGNMAGIGGLKAIRAILPQGTKVYAVGGAGPDNFAEWIAASADGFGIGSGIYKPGMSTETIAKNAAAIVTAYDEVINDL